MFEKTWLYLRHLNAVRTMRVPINGRFRTELKDDFIN